jgi:hypothetical protein
VMDSRRFAVLFSASGGDTGVLGSLNFQGEIPKSDLCWLYSAMVAFQSFSC